MRFRFSFLVFLLFLACTENKNIENAPTKFDKDAEIVSIINATLPILLPDSIVRPFGYPILAAPTSESTKMADKMNDNLKQIIAKHGVTVFLDSNFLTAENFTLPHSSHDQTLDLTQKLRSAKMVSKHFSFSKIKNYGHVRLISKKLINPPFPNNYFGVAYFSFPLFNSNYQKATFVFGKHKYPSCIPIPDEIVEVEKQHGKWLITRRR